MVRNCFLIAAVAALALPAANGAFAQETVKIGFILPMTGQQQSTGKQEAAAIKLYMAQHGDTVAGKKIEMIIRDDARRSGQHQAPRAGTDRQRQGEFPRRLRRHAGGAFGRAAGHGSQDAGDRDGGRHLDHHREVALHRAHQLHAGAIDRAMADWAAKNGIKKVVTMISDYAPGVDAEKSFTGEFIKKGGEMVESDPLSAGQSRFRAVPAARGRPEARRHVRFRSFRAGRPPSSSNSSSAASTRPASRSSAPAT